MCILTASNWYGLSPQPCPWASSGEKHKYIYRYKVNTQMIISSAKWGSRVEGGKGKGKIYGLISSLVKA